METLWDHPDNAELKAKRANPNVLFPGDVLVVPDKTTKSVTVATGAEHRFMLRRQRLVVRVALVDLLRKPIAGVSCTFTVEGKEMMATTDGDGQVEVVVDAKTREVKFTARGHTQVLEVGGLDPASEVSGVQSRLRNLGYYLGIVGDESDENEFAFSLRSFQADNKLDVTGKPDDPTLAKLLEVHGS